ncbi:hypothetical protein Tco_1271443 [Tanacetum coccineum]
MAQPQRQADVHKEELCLPNKCYALMDANKKIDLDNPLCPNESKILANILQNHPLRFSIAASLSVPWIYLGQFEHTLKEDGSKYRLSFMLDRKELTLTLNDFSTIFQLPQATDNNHERFVAGPKFPETIPFFLDDLGFTLELRSPSNFKTTGLVQQWQTLCKTFSRCLTTRVTSYDQPPLQIMQMLYCFINNVNVDYADLLWEGLHYSLEHLSTLIPYPRFIKIIVSHYMTAFLEISRRVRDKYHNLKDDEMVKSIFNSRKNKAGFGMKILNWMITDEMKLTENYRMYTAVFGVKEHLAAEEIEKMVEGTNTVDVDEFVNYILNSQNDPGTRLDSGSYNESPEGKHVEESRNTPSPTPIRSLRIHSTLMSLDTEKLQELTKERKNLRAEITSQINNAISNHIPSLVDSSVISYMSNHLQQADLSIWLALKIKFEGLTATNTLCRSFAIRPRDQDDHHDDAHPEGENNKYATDDDELPTENVSQELMEEMSETESRKEILSLPFPQKSIPVVQSCQRDPKAPALSLVNQDLLYLKKRNSGSKKFLLSLHKFPTVIFPDDDIEERTSRWVDKCVKKFNPYA